MVHASASNLQHGHPQRAADPAATGLAADSALLRHYRCLHHPHPLALIYNLKRTMAWTERGACPWIE